MLYSSLSAVWSAMLMMLVVVDTCSEWVLCGTVGAVDTVAGENYFLFFVLSDVKKTGNDLMSA